MRFLLDTDTCIDALKQNESVLRNLLSTAREDVAKSSSPVKTLRLIENFLRPLAILDFTSEDAKVYATVRAKLERAGTPIGPLDTLIASQAIARKLTLVSNNEREFRRVSSLAIANWTS